MNYRDFLRLAAEVGLIETVKLWFEFREARNKTSHAYIESHFEELLLKQKSECVSLRSML